MICATEGEMTEICGFLGFVQDQASLGEGVVMP